MSDSITTTITEGNHIPDAVRRQSQRADDIARAAGVANVPEAEPGLPTTTTTVVELPTPPAPAAPGTDSGATPAPTAENWEQKYRTLQGKYDTEVPGLRAQLDGIQRVLAAVQSAPPTAHVAPTPTPAAEPVDPKDAEEFGPDLIVAARRWARAEVAADIESLRTELNELRSNTKTVQANQAQTTIMNVLDHDPELGDRWRVINNNPQFIAWLELRDPFSGHQRILMLRDAYAAGDAVRTMAFFKAFITEHTVVNPAPGGTPAHTPEAPGTGGPTLTDLAAPGRASGPPSVGAPADKRVWTTSDIATFYRDVQRGVWAGRDADKQSLERDIVAAAREGRVR